MTINEFLKIKKNITNAMHDYKVIKYEKDSGFVRITLQHKDDANKKEEFSYKSQASHAVKQYNKLTSLNTLTNIFGKFRPIEYVLMEEFLNCLTVPRHIEFDLNEQRDELDMARMSDIITTLGGNYTLPDKLIREQFDKSEKDIENTFVFNGKVAQLEISKLNELLLKYAIVRNSSLPKEQLLLLARVMSKEEYEAFKKDGIVFSSPRHIRRIWEDANLGGEEGDYTFMAFCDTESALRNITAVVEYLEKDCDDKYLVFFQTENLPYTTHSSGPYRGMQYTCYGESGFEGVDYSYEVSVPFYDNKNFKELSVHEVDMYKLQNIVINKLKEVGFLTLPEGYDLTSTYFDDFTKNKEFEDLGIDEKTVKEIENFSCDEKIKQYNLEKTKTVRVMSYLEEYYTKKDQTNTMREQDSVKIALQFAKFAQEKYELSEEEAFKVAGHLWQYNENWGYSCPEEEYDKYDEYADEYYCEARDDCDWNR